MVLRAGRRSLWRGRAAVGVGAADELDGDEGTGGGVGWRGGEEKPGDAGRVG